MTGTLTALAGRSEIRDLVDVHALEAAGWRVESALSAALQKDGGATAATIAWVQSEIAIPDRARLPGGGDPAALRLYRNAPVTTEGRPEEGEQSLVLVDRQQLAFAQGPAPRGKDETHESDLG